MELALWEYDNFLFTHRLGKFTMLVNELGGPFKTDLLREGEDYASYSVEWVLQE